MEDSIKETPRWLSKSRVQQRKEKISHRNYERTWIRRLFKSEKTWEEEKGLEDYLNKEKVE